MDRKLRVFICYSERDIQLVEQLVEILNGNGINPLWSKKLTHGTGSSGRGFDEEIKVFIQHAHVFMPVLSKSSSEWLHQEIGYAKALNIPVLPVTQEEINPGGMLQMNNALKLGNSDSEIQEQLEFEKFDKLMQVEAPIALYKRAAYVEKRAEMMADYAKKVSLMKQFGVVRQKGGLSSFHIPDNLADKKAWTERYYPSKKSSTHINLQCKEREALEDHVNASGCKLIIKPSYALKGRSKIAAKSRLNTLIKFLQSKSDKQVVIAIQDDKAIESLTIVGDWFLAESVSFKHDDGFTNTFFTRNAAEIIDRINQFDDELKYALRECGWNEENSRVKAIEELSRILNKI